MTWFCQRLCQDTADCIMAKLYAQHNAFQCRSYAAHVREPMRCGVTERPPSLTSGFLSGVEIAGYPPDIDQSPQFRLRIAQYFHYSRWTRHQALRLLQLGTNSEILALMSTASSAEYHTHRQPPIDIDHFPTRACAFYKSNSDSTCVCRTLFSYDCHDLLL